MAVSSPEPWTVKDGVLAEISFDVEAGADLNKAVLALSEVEVTPDGFDNRMISGFELNVGSGEVEETKPPVVVEKTTVVQTLDLKKGWNLISFYVESEDMTPATVLGSITDSLACRSRT